MKPPSALAQPLDVPYGQARTCSALPACDLCGCSSVELGSYTVLGKHDARVGQCSTCGYTFAVDPLWLEEAYSSPMTRVDLGKVQRGFDNTRITKVVIDFFHSTSGRYLDFGGGYGLLVRRMRDLGYNFFRHDTYAANLFAEGFDHSFAGNAHFDLVTAFEVVEHLVRPHAVLEQILSASDSFLFSTLLMPEPAPDFDAWWYFGPEHGQHVSFFTRRSLYLLAQRHGKRFVTNGFDLHLITNKRVPERLFRFATTRWVGAAVELFHSRPSLLQGDFEERRRCILAEMDSDRAIH